MRELNNSEIESVSGGWLFSDIGSGVGYLVGSIVDLGAFAGGLTNTTASSSSAYIGSGIGKIVELNISGAIDDIGKGVVGFLQCAVNTVNSLNNSNSAS